MWQGERDQVGSHLGPEKECAKVRSERASDALLVGWLREVSFLPPVPEVENAEKGRRRKRWRLRRIIIIIAVAVNVAAQCV